MLRYSTTFETVTYDGDTNIPEITGYGEHVEVSVTLNNHTNPSTLYVTIGTNHFLPEQLEGLLKIVDKVKASTLLFN